MTHRRLTQALAMVLLLPGTVLATLPYADWPQVQETPVVHPRPRILTRTGPTRLVLLDGPPVFAATVAEGVEVLANSDTLILRAGHHVYLHVGPGWVEATSLAGPWLPRRGWPTPMLQLPASGTFRRLRELFEEGPSRTEVEVIVSRHQVELVQIDGPPQLEAIPGTRLQWVTNTDSDLFTHPSRPGYFLLVSGRWFHIDSGDDLGEYVSTRLPADFRRIPGDHPRSHVLASVPGTPEAEEAVIAVDVPRYRTVSPDQVDFSTRFEGGAPRWRPIPGSDLEEATNSSQDVLRLGDRWLACDGGVWFESRAPGHSWELVRQPPREISTIPPWSSKHRLAYTDQISLEDGQVRAAVRGGYFGTYAAGGVVVHGTGHEYDHTPAFYRDALRRIQQFYDEGAADPLAWPRPSLRESFYLRTYGYGFRYDPSQALFRPTRTGSASTRAPRPRRSDAGRLSQEEVEGRTIYPAADGRLYRRSVGGEWERLGPKGWVTSEAPENLPATRGPAGRVGHLGRLPPAPTKEAASGPVQLRPTKPTEPAEEGAEPAEEATRPGPARIMGTDNPKIPDGYGAYRWTNQYDIQPPTWNISPSVPPPFGYYPPGRYPTVVIP